MVRACLLSLVFWITPGYAERVYQQPDAFVAEAFGGQAPAPAVLWLTGELKAEVRAILDHDYPALRLRYWGEGVRSAWVLEEIGKESPITVGIVVEKDAVFDHQRLEQIINGATRISVITFEPTTTNGERSVAVAGNGSRTETIPGPSAVIADEG